MKHQQNSIAERLRIEIKHHSWQQEQNTVEEQEVQKALNEIEKSKRIALERFKAEEMQRLAQERESMAHRRHLDERDMRGLSEPAEGMLS